MVSFFQNNIWKYLKDISFVDIIDIAVLSLLLYLVFQFLKDRRAGKLMMGLGIFSALLVLSTILNMHAVKYILQNFYQIGLIAVVIVFQPELRAALEKVGNSPIRGFRGLVSDTGEAEAVSADVEAICEAVCDMARSKTGALIVIERQTKLGDVMKTGVMINAQISSFLLRNIFFNNAPLHDGAVIIRNHHICAAGCFLPLSTTDDIVRDLGTRHRAAIGMSEASDAIVIVVSEETGTISTAINGTLKRNYNYNLLRQELLQLLVHNPHHLPRAKNADAEK
ncbi:MAG: diadenylate cyclase CdaA [Clostridia bacterium]|nr:diadenylate cyclase CdaA [Clostridia bacterium]